MTRLRPSSPGEQTMTISERMHPRSEQAVTVAGKVRNGLHVLVCASPSGITCEWWPSMPNRLTEVELTRYDHVARISGRTQWSSPRLRSGDTDRLRASQLQHAVQDRDADVHLGGLTLVRARAQPVADHPFKPADRCLSQRTAIVAGGFLPTHTAVLGDKL